MRLTDGGDELTDILQDVLDGAYLEITRRKELYGGWRREDGRWVVQDAARAAAFHLACRALYCKVCKSQGHMRRIGFVGTSESEEFACPVGHGSFRRMEAYVPRTMAIQGGRQSGKTSTALPEFCSWQLGYRPWDGTLTCPRVPYSDWILASPTLKTSEAVTLGARYERMMKRHIVKPLRNNSGWQLDAECSFARVHKFSYSQWDLTKNRKSNPFYDLMAMGTLWDEAMEEGAHLAILRGLLKNRSVWGREIIAATLSFSSYLRRTVVEQAFNLGGSKPSVFCIKMTTNDNPIHDEESVSEFLAEIAEESRESWRTGEYIGDGYLALPQYDDEIGGKHVYEPEDGDIAGKHLPPNDSVIVVVDPHLSKPYAITFIAIGQDGKHRVFREWPEANFQNMKSSKYSIDDYVSLLFSMAEELPGGASRVIRWFMDPRAGGSPVAGTGSRTLKDLFRAKGIVFDTKFSASVDLRVEKVRNWFKENKILISSVCRNTRRSLSRLHFKTDADGRILRNAQTGEGRLDDEDKDFFDNVGYAAVIGMSPRPWKAMNGN